VAATRPDPRAGAAVTPYSDNIVFVDTEFSGLDVYLGELISIAAVKPGGEELYLELEYTGPVNDFVRREVLPKLTGPKVPPAEAAARIKAFVGPGKPYMVSHGGHYDALYVYKPFGIEEHPFHWLPLDFASMLFGRGIRPRTDDLAEQFGIDRSGFRSDHALDDARLYREFYLRATRGRRQTAIQAPGRAPLFRKIDCLQVPVPDADAGLAFYRDRLGHELIWRTATSAGLRMPESEAEIVLQTERSRLEANLTVASADEAAAAIVAAGGRVVVLPFDIPIGRCAVVADPWGNRLVVLDTSKGLLVTGPDGWVVLDPDGKPGVAAADGPVQSA
jgi:predicted enzyme related to lactoylglutathione lyase